jgi:hypothetical protein
MKKRLFFKFVFLFVVGISVVLAVFFKSNKTYVEENNFETSTFDDHEDLFI